MAPKKKAKGKLLSTKTKILDVRYLIIKHPPGKIDPLVRNSIKLTGLWCLDQVKPDLPQKKKGTIKPEDVRDFLMKKLLKYAPKIHVITKKLNTDTAMIDAKTRGLLANRDVYMYLLYDTIKTIGKTDVVYVQKVPPGQNGKNGGKKPGRGRKAAPKKKAAKKTTPKGRGKGGASKSATF